MLRKGKKLISKLLFLSICTSLIPTTIAFAEKKDNTQETVTNVIQTTGAAVSINQSDFEFDANTGTITKYTGSETEVVIPSEINGVKVTSIGDSAFYSSSSLSDYNNITSITMPESIKCIGDNAFRNCKKLTRIKIPDNVVRIGNNAFRDCSSLENIEMPKNLTCIGDYAFGGCTMLKKITIPDKVMSIGNNAFLWCNSITSITIPDCVSSIGGLAFYGDSKLKEIYVGDNNKSYKSIDGVLYSKDGNQIIQYPAGKEDENYTIKAGVKNIGSDAFSNNRKLKSIAIPKSVISIGDSSFFACANLESVVIPDDVTSLTNKTFAYCDNLKRISMPANITSLDSNVFEGCNKDVIFWVRNEEIKQLLTNIGVSSSKIKIGTGLINEIELNNTSLNLKIQNTSLLTATISPDNAINKLVKWTTSNSEVVTVDENGKVTAVGAGSATITCTASDGSGKSATCDVTVTIPVIQTTVTLNNTNLDLKKGDTSTLTATVSPSTTTNTAVTWESSDTSVAIVDANGKVTAVGAGSATITCTASDGSGKSATCNVTVTIPAIETTITLNKTNLDLKKGDTSTLTATVSPSTTTNTAVTWESSDTSVVIVDENGKVTSVGAGSATITCTANDGSGKSDTCHVTVRLILSRKVLNDEISYAQGVANKLNDAISAAKAVADNGGATETDVNNAAETLLEADRTLADTLSAGILGINSVDFDWHLSTVAGTVPKLPTTADITFSDGTTTSTAVTWNTAATDVTTYTYAGEVNITGTLEAYDNYEVNGYVNINLAVGKTETNSEIVLSLCGDVAGSGIPFGTVKVFFKLNVDNQEDYNVIVRGKTAIYDTTRKVFSVLVNGSDINFNSFKFIPSDFEVTKI